MIARRLGYRVMLLERGRHPRFAIGESASPLAGVLIEQLADCYDLPRLRPLSAYGTWQRAYPDVVCGLKRGFTYFKHEHGQRYRCTPDRSNQLLVAASPSDEVSDTHWLRADVDHFLVREAVGLGAEYLDEIALEGVERPPDGTFKLTGLRRGASVDVSAQFVVDASGPRGFLGRALGIPERGFDNYPATQALFSHFTDVARCDEMVDFDPGLGTRDSGLDMRGAANLESRVPDPGSRVPYPIDDAALHHVFDGGWMWVLRFGNGITSAGIAVIDSLAEELRLADGAPAWDRFLARYPSIAAQFADARPIREFTWMPRLTYRASVAAGDGWALLPSAAAFIDPLFSTGIPLTLMGIERLGRILDVRAPSREVRLKPDTTSATVRLKADTTSATVRLKADTTSYNATTLAEADHTSRFIAGCYAAFPRFDAFTAYSMFYFVAASFSEMERRLVPDARPRGFLRAADADFAAAMRELSPAAQNPGPDFRARIAKASDRLNIAGLCDAAKRNWYPVDLEDTARSASKLGLTSDRVREAVAQYNLALSFRIENAECRH
jgi:FADH2 O2-dependent halogenase